MPWQKFKDRMDRALYHVVDIIRRHIRPYDIFGKADSTTFGILQIGMSLSKAKIWAERLRQDIASNVIDIDDRRFTVTVSMGLADTEKADSIDMLVANTRKAIDISLEKTNTVTVFS